MTKTALITGITGQDGAYLADFLLKKGYEVHGLRQPVAVPDTERLNSLLGPAARHVDLHYADLTDTTSLISLMKKIAPDEVYNLAAQSHVHASFLVPDQTLQVNAAGTLRLLETIRLLDLGDKIRFFQASTSELFGDAPAPQMEGTVMIPRSPYAAAKLYAYHMTRLYREAYGLYACNGIMFNHESPLRGEEFVTRKIARAVAGIIKGTQPVLWLGNLDAKRDWSHAQDMMEGAWLMMQQERADDYVLASGVAHSVRDFVIAAFKVAGVELSWQGSGPHETATDIKTGRTVVRIDPECFRPLDVENLLGDPGKARSQLDWSPRIDFQMLVTEMVEAELSASKDPSSADAKELLTYG